MNSIEDAGLDLSSFKDDGVAHEMSDERYFCLVALIVDFKTC